MKKTNIISSIAALSIVLGMFSATPAEARGNNSYNQMAQAMMMQAQVNRAQEAASADAYQQAQWQIGHDPSLYTAVPGVGVVPSNSATAQAYNSYAAPYGFSPFGYAPYSNVGFLNNVSGRVHNWEHRHHHW